MFINSLTGPYYDKMIGNTSTLFADVVIIGERVEQGLKSGRIAQQTSSNSSTQNFKKNFGKKKEGDVNAINFATPSSSSQQTKSRRPERKFTPIPTSYGIKHHTLVGTLYKGFRCEVNWCSGKLTT